LGVTSINSEDCLAILDFNIPKCTSCRWFFPYRNRTLGATSSEIGLQRAIVSLSTNIVESIVTIYQGFVGNPAMIGRKGLVLMASSRIKCSKGSNGRPRECLSGF